MIKKGSRGRPPQKKLQRKEKRKREGLVEEDKIPKNENFVGNDQSVFITAGEALKKLGQDFNDWSSILTTHSVQASYAIIAANWAVHSDANAILVNCYSKWSLVIFLGLNLLCTQLMIRMHYRQYIYAEKDSERWQKEFKETRGKRTYWPYTKNIEHLGVFMRWLKVWAPVISAFLFIISLFHK